jgi:hypothetical protein
MGESLVDECQFSSFSLYQKSVGMLPLTDDERTSFASDFDVVVTGVGDCGGCTACSVTDALLCQELGLPSFVVVTESFVQLAQSTEAEYGVSGMVRLAVDHPIWTQDQEWFTATGRSLALQVSEHLAVMA